MLTKELAMGQFEQCLHRQGYGGYIPRTGHIGPWKGCSAIIWAKSPLRHQLWIQFPSQQITTLDMDGWTNLSQDDSCGQCNSFQYKLHICQTVYNGDQSSFYLQVFMVCVQQRIEHQSNVWNRVTRNNTGWSPTEPAVEFDWFQWEWEGLLMSWFPWCGHTYDDEFIYPHTFSWSRNWFFVHKFLGPLVSHECWCTSPLVSYLNTLLMSVVNSHNASQCCCNGEGLELRGGHDGSPHARQCGLLQWRTEKDQRHWGTWQWNRRPRCMHSHQLQQNGWE